MGTLEKFAETVGLDRGNRGSAHVPSCATAVSWFVSRFPPWVENEAARNVFCVAFDDGWVAFKRRAQNVLSLPEAKGREIEALDLAVNADLSASDIAAILRSRSDGGDVVPFPVGRGAPAVVIRRGEGIRRDYFAENDPA